MVMTLYPRHSNEYRRKHGEHVCLDKCHKHFHTVHEDTEQYGYNTHGGTDGSTHTGCNKDDTG